MRHLLTILFLAFTSTTFSQGIPENVHRVLFLGNSITYAGSYVNYIETYFISQYPKQHIEFINVGLPSETVSGLSEEGHAGGKFPRPDLHERLDRVLSLTHPDLVFACYGMNDGIYKPFDEGRFKLYKDGINWLHNAVIKTGAKIIHITPPIYDELKGKKVGYASVLDKYSDWLISQKDMQKWEVIDLHYPMKNYLEAHRKVDAEFNLDGFYLAADGVHPGELGHWIMARSILQYLGAKEVAQAPDLLSTLKPEKKPLLELVTKRQAIMKDAWLTACGHKRPDMKIGLPLEEAKQKTEEVSAKIDEIRK